MTDVRDRVSTALADRYRIERHLGAGGMATVYFVAEPSDGGRTSRRAMAYIAS